MRTLRLLLVTSMLSLGCGSSTTPSGGDAGVDAGTDAAVADTSVEDSALPDTGAPDTGPTEECDCRPGTYTVSGSGTGSGGAPFSVSYDLEITETCGSDPVCVVDGTERNCGYLLGGVPGGFRINLDGLGFVQLIFTASACEEPWQGTYATEGGSATVTAERVD